MIGYIAELRQHYERYYEVRGNVLHWTDGPTGKLPSHFFVLELPPGNKHGMWTYATVGMSAGRNHEEAVELIVYAAGKDRSIVELLTMAASFHKNAEPLGLHHTVNVGKGESYAPMCDHGFISLPYLDGEKLELFTFDGQTTHIYWFIPITERERRYKVKNGCEALEQLFEEKQLDYLDFNRASLV